VPASKRKKLNIEASPLPTITSAHRMVKTMGRAGLMAAC